MASETLGRLLAHSRFEADKPPRKQWFCVTGGHHKIISFRAEFPNYTFQALYRRRQDALKYGLSRCLRKFY